ncbi:MAG: flagellar basal body L-ring protein FlgH [Planctomycetota bacterium]
MNRRVTQFARPLLAAAAAWAAITAAGPLHAQDGGLLHQTPPPAASAGPGPAAGVPGGLTLANSSYLHRPLPPEAEYRALQKEDIITVIVDYRSSMLSEGEAESRKTANLNAVLTEWIGFDGKSIFRGPQSRGDPAIAGQLDSQYRAEGDLQLRDSLTFRIAAKVVDIRPNNNLVIEAHRTITINDEVWQQSLTGVVRRQAIGLDNTVRSDSIADLKIHKRELGQVRNAYAPGWLNFWWGKAKPF